MTNWNTDVCMLWMVTDVEHAQVRGSDYHYIVASFSIMCNFEGGKKTLTCKNLTKRMKSHRKNTSTN